MVQVKVLKTLVTPVSARDYEGNGSKKNSQCSVPFELIHDVWCTDWPKCSSV